MATTKATATKKAAAKKTTANTKSTPRKKKISADDIRVRAEQIYQERLNKGQHGDELSDWLSAEEELHGTKS